MTKVRCNVSGEGIVFSSVREVMTAFQCGKVSLHARIKVRLDSGVIVSTAVGRVILYEALPLGSDFDWVNKILQKNDLKKMIETIYYTFGSAATVICLDKIKKLGFFYSTQSGSSCGITDLVSPQQKDAIVRSAEKEVVKFEKLYRDGVITNGERKNKVISTWFRATSDIANEMLKGFEQQDKEGYLNEKSDLKRFNPVYMFLASGAKGSKDQIKQLVGIRGLMATPSGDIIETPVKRNFTQGLSVFEYFISTHGARKGQADTALRTANSGYLTRRLVDVAHDLVVTINDCKALGYISLSDLKEGGDVVSPLSARVYGRVAADDIKDPITGEILVKQGEVVTRKTMVSISKSAVSDVFVRSVLACQAKRGVCQKCYGYDLSKGALVDVGTPIGIIAAQSIGEPGTQLTMRTFHIGGTASGEATQTSFESKSEGTVELRGIRTVKNKAGQETVFSRKGEVIVRSEDGREMQTNVLDYGSVLLVTEGQKVAKGDKLAEWDPSAYVIMTEKAGTIEYVDLVKNITIQDEFDEESQRSVKTVLSHKGEKYQPALAVMDDAGNEIAHYYIPVGAYLSVEHGEKVFPGDVIIRTPRAASKTKDITVGGLPRIAELFEARAPKDIAILSDIDGTAVFGGLYRGMRKITISSGTTSYDYFIPRDKQLIIHDGDKLQAGDQLTNGSPVLQDILRILGSDKLQRYIVNHIQEIYRLQGVDINDRHIEVIVRQMMRKIRVIDSGDSDFLVGDRVDKIHFKAVNELLRQQGKRVAVATPVLIGLTQASLGTESFLSAASFQETTRILAEAAISGQTDYLYGLKENLTIGKLIPAGTGVTSFREKYIGDDFSDLEWRAQFEEEKMHRMEECAKN